MRHLTKNVRLLGALIVATSLGLAACGGNDESTTDTPPPTAESTSAPAESTAAPADDPLAALYEECKAEGKVNLIALPDEWANYKGILQSFRDKYPGVENPVANPDASSAEEMEAVETLAGQPDMPDNVDVSPAIAQEMVNRGLFEPYVHEDRPDRPEDLRRPQEARVQGLGRVER